MHGFSQEASYFQAMAEPMRGQYQLWSVDLPGHGKTKWPVGKACKPADLRKLGESILQATGAQRCSIAGFSMGGRYAEGLVTGMPDRVESLHLISPEGLRPNYGLGFSTGNPLGRWLLRTQRSHPGFILWPTQLLAKSGLMPKKLMDFFLFHLKRPEMRTLLHDSWMAMSGLPRADRAFAALLRQHRIRSFIWIGKYDILVRIRDGKQFAASAEGGLEVLDRGHFLVDREFASKMLDAES